MGHDVVGLTEPARADALNAGKPLVHEPGLSELLHRGIAAGRLRFVASPRDAVEGAELVYLSLDTPVADDDSPLLDEVYRLAKTIGNAIVDDVILCVTAQVPVGTTEALALVVEEMSGRRCSAAYVPEFLRLGTALETFREADRFAIGANEPAVGERVAELYRSLGRPIVITDIRSAELAKHAANAFLAVSISFANELADIAEQVGADFDHAAEILRLDRRIGRDAFLSPGLGYAGGTLGRELRVLQNFGVKHGVPTPLLDATVAVNNRRRELPRRKLEKSLGDLNGRVVALLGLTYKPGTSTLRRAISLEIARDLLAASATVNAFDPLADLTEVSDAPALVIERDPYIAATGADAVIFVTEWERIDDLDLGRVAAAMRGRVVLDAQGIVDPARVAASGLEYHRL
ncbi:MAG: UDP-glucose dehydrogenase family protein [Gaiellaceae bacterium]